ncbi:D-alanine--D-alanine ligase [Patescibacteria group bacterium]|nr:MAG: D-alanine--D-alanine ligase [Patescibacteria group bacterium]
MSKIRVGVLRGGPSSEYDVSLKTGAAVLKHLPDIYHAQDIFVSKDGLWHKGGIVYTPGEIIKHLDVIFNALHGEYGEDGKVQHLLDTFNIPYTGSGYLASVLGMNKVLAKKVFTEHGIKTPHHKTVRKGEYAHADVLHLFKTFPMPAVVKPVRAGSSVGVSIARTLHELEEALKKALTHDTEALIEEYIPGREATCGVIEGFRGEALYSLLPVEIVPDKECQFFDYEAKYAGKSKEICPGNFTKEEIKKIQNASVAVHKALGLRHYSRSDFIVHPKRGIYILEVNTLPGLTPESLFPLSLEAVGSSLPEFLGHVLGIAMKK